MCSSLNIISGLGERLEKHEAPKASVLLKKPQGPGTQNESPLAYSHLKKEREKERQRKRQRCHSRWLLTKLF